MSYVPPAGEQKMKTDDGKGATEQRTMTFEPGERLSGAPDVARDADTTDLVSPQEERVPVLSARLHRDGLEVSGPIREKRFSSKEGRDPRAERIYQVNLERAAKVGRMVSKIEESMTEGDMDHAKVLIDQLADLKGEESPYLLKLRAFWHMRQRDYASAASLLARVLEKEEDDLEAGINMAIIELQTRRPEEARKRLARLREIYQANTLIPELIRETGW
jgi:tetratricopeptide (TPR) repeat protein